MPDLAIKMQVKAQVWRTMWRGGAGVIAVAALLALAGIGEAGHHRFGLVAQVQGPGAGQPAGQQTPPPEIEPTYTPDSGGSSWTTVLQVVGMLVFIGFVGTVLYLAIKHGKNLERDDEQEGKIKRKAGGVKVTEDQIDNYRLLNLMNTGQTSQVYEVAEVASGRHFALKMLLPEHAKSSAQRFLMFHEAEVGQQIFHPKIIKMLSIKKDPYYPYLIMEYFPSKNLKLRLMHKEDAFIKQHLRGIIEQAATALAFMHEKKWVHRDVKPDNILVNSSGEVRLIDFAIAKRIQRKPGLLGTKKNKAQGTRSYMAPEQIRGQWLDARADIYSFGATLYELVTGRPPFTARNPQELLTKQLNDKPEPPQVYNHDLSDEFNKLIISMLAKDREGRPRDFTEFLLKFRGLRFLFKSDVVRKKVGPSGG